MKIINTSTTKLSSLSEMEQYALYSGMDNLALFEILEGLQDLMTPSKLETYGFEMELQAPLLEMSFNGILVDQQKRQELIRHYEAELQKVQTSLHELCSAIGYYEYYTDRAIIQFSREAQVDPSTLPRSWEEWTLRPISWRRAIKSRNPQALVDYHKALKEFGPPYIPGDRKEWQRKKNGAFNGNSPAQKLRLFYDFFGSPDNQNASKDFVSSWNKTRGISEIRTRDQKGEYTPSTDRECLEKIQHRGLDFDERDAYYWALPFVACCLEITDYAKILGFLRCRLESGYFKSSFGAVTETGRLNSKENAQGFGSNAQNVSPPLRIIFTAEPGWKLATPDYEQIESRNVGAICYRLFGATSYLNSCECGDLHTLVASLVWPELGWPEEFTLDYLEKYGPPFPAEIIKAAKAIAKSPFYRHFSLRDAVKRLGHGSNYRGQPPHMAKQTHIPLELVRNFQHLYFSRFPELPRWHQWVVEQVQTKGEITTMFGRTRRFFGRPTEDSTIREAIAHEPQSMAADYTNRALLRLFKAYLYDSLPIKIFLQKHDEIGFRYLEKDEDLILPKCCDIMIESHTITSPSGQQRQWQVPVEAQSGWNLAHADEQNPDGLRVYAGHDSRRRQSNPSDYLKWRV